MKMRGGKGGSRWEGATCNSSEPCPVREDMEEG